MAKRTSTWGNITKRKNGTYRLRYPIAYDAETGKRIIASETIHGTKKEAETRLAELRIQYACDEHLPLSLTVETFWVRHYFPYIQKTLAPSTVRGYASSYECHIKPTWGKFAMEDISVSAMKNWLQSMTYGAAKKQLSTMRAMFNYAEDEELIKRNVMNRRFRLPSKNTARKNNDQIHDKETLDAILEDCRDEFWEAGFIVSAFGGLRREEAFGIKKNEIIFNGDHAIVPVNRTVQRISGRIVISDEEETSPETKTPESKRLAVIVHPYAQRLKEIMDDPEREGDIWMLDDGFGEPIDPERAAKAYMRWYLYKPYCYIPWKNLRSSYATMLHQQCVPIETIAKLLGHTNVSTTYKYYEKPNVEHLVETISNALSL